MSGAPAIQMRAARIAGRLVAQGLLDESEILPPILRAAARSVPAAAARPALEAALREACRIAEYRRGRATWQVRDALAPLVAARAGRAALLAAARAADPDRLLLRHERRAIAEDLVRRALARRFGMRRR